MKFISTLALTLSTLFCTAQVLNTTEGEIQSTVLSGSGDRNVVANPDGILKIGSSGISTYYFSPDRAQVLDENFSFFFNLEASTYLGRIVLE